MRYLWLVLTTVTGALTPISAWCDPADQPPIAAGPLAAVDEALAKFKADPDHADVDALASPVRAYLHGLSATSPDPTTMWATGDLARRVSEVAPSASVPATHERVLMLAVEVYDTALGLWRHQMPAKPDRSAAAMYLAMADVYGELNRKDQQVKCYVEVATGRFDGTTAKDDPDRALLALVHIDTRAFRPLMMRKVARQGAQIAIALALLALAAHKLRQRHIERYHRPRWAPTDRR